MIYPPLPKELASFAESQARHYALNELVKAYGQSCINAAKKDMQQTKKADSHAATYAKGVADGRRAAMADLRELIGITKENLE